jgi:hypothetical protein
MRSGSPKSATQIAHLNDPKLANPALQPNHGGVGSVVRAQFGEDVSDSTFGCQSKGGLFEKVCCGMALAGTDREQRVCVCCTFLAGVIRLL